MVSFNLSATIGNRAEDAANQAHVALPPSSRSTSLLENPRSPANQPQPGFKKFPRVTRRSLPLGPGVMCPSQAIYTGNRVRAGRCCIETVHDHRHSCCLEHMAWRLYSTAASQSHLVWGTGRVTMLQGADGHRQSTGIAHLLQLVHSCCQRFDRVVALGSGTVAYNGPPRTVHR